MSDNPVTASGEKIVGIPVEKIAKLSYLMILASTGFALFLTFAGILGIWFPGSTFFGGIGLAAVALSLLSLFVFEERFSELDKSHFKFIALVYVTFFAAVMVVGSILTLFGSLGFLVVFLVAALQFFTFYTGFKLHKNGELADNANLSAAYEGYKGMIFKNFKKAEEKTAEAVKKTTEPSEEAETSSENDNQEKPESVDKSA